jgi:hypothetical protein
MGTAIVTVREVRFLIEDEVTQVYVLIVDETPGETPIGATGWKHKTFPASVSMLDILNNWTKDDPMMWDSGAPK